VGRSVLAWWALVLFQRLAVLTDILRPSILHFDGQFLTVRFVYYAWRQIYWFVVRGA
jgi:hypothetical protein